MSRAKEDVGPLSGWDEKLLLVPREPRSTSHSVAVATAKFLLKASPLLVIPIGVLSAISYWQGWWGAFGLDESMLRSDLLSLHLLSFNLALYALISIVAVLCIGAGVAAFSGYFLFYSYGILSKWSNRVAYRVRARYKFSWFREGTRWFESGEMVHQLSVYFLVVLLFALIVTTFPAKYAHDFGQARAIQFKKQGYVGAQDSQGNVYIGCAESKSDAGRQLQGLLLGCGDRFCGIVESDGDAAVVPVSSLVQAKAFQQAATKFQKSPAYKFCANADFGDSFKNDQKEIGV